VPVNVVKHKVYVVWMSSAKIAELIEVQFGTLGG